MFDDLPGAGKALDLDEELLVPEDVRMAYRILKNAGFVPDRGAARNGGPAAPTRAGIRRRRGRTAAAKLALLEMRLETQGRLLPHFYREGVAAKLAAG